MSPEPFISRGKALPAKRSAKGYGDENESELEKKALELVPSAEKFAYAYKMCHGF